MPYKFVTPKVKEGPIGGHRLFEFYQMNRGITVANMNGQYVQMRYPSMDVLANCPEYYLGGSEYIVSDATATALTTAGYGNFLTLISS